MFSSWDVLDSGGMRLERLGNVLDFWDYFVVGGIVYVLCLENFCVSFIVFWLLDILCSWRCRELCSIPWMI